MSLGLGNQTTLRSRDTKNPYGIVMPKYAQAVSQVRAGVRDATVVVLDDSTGNGFATSLATTLPESKAWPNLVAEMMTEVGTPAQWSSGKPAYASANHYDTRATISGSSFTIPTGGWGPFSGGFASACHQNTSTSTKIRWTPGFVADLFDVYYIQLNSGTISAQATGGSVVNQQTGGPGSIQKFTVSAASISDSNWVELWRGTAPAYIVGIVARSSAQKRVQIFNGSIPGARVADFSLPGSGWNSPSMLAALQPDLVVIGCGINEAMASRPVGQFTADVATLASYCRGLASAPDVLVKSCAPSGGGFSPLEGQYRDALVTLCSANGYGFVDVFGGFGNAYSPALMADQLHPNDAGQVRIAEIMRFALLI